MLGDMALQKTNFGAAYVISSWIIFPFPGPISEHNILSLDK